MKLTGLFLFSMALFFGCTSTVNLKLVTADERPHVGHLVNASNSSEPLMNVYVTKEQPQNLEFKIKKNSVLKINSSPQPERVVFTCCRENIIVSDNDFYRQITLSHGMPYFDDEGSVDKMADSFKELGDDIGFRPLNIQNALRGIIGGVVFVSFADNEPKIVHQISPGRFGNPVMSLNDLVWNNNLETHDIQISGSKLLQNAGKFPFIGQLGIEGDHQSMYKMNWTISGYGYQNYKEPDALSISNNLKNLDSGEIATLKEFVVEHKEKGDGYRILYIDQFYAVKNVSFEVIKAKEKKAGFDVSSAFLTSNGVFEFNNSDRKTVNFSDMVFNVSGNVITLSTENPITKGDEIVTVFNEDASIFLTLESERLRVAINE